MHTQTHVHSHWGLKTYLFHTLPQFNSLRPQTQLVLGPKRAGQSPWAVRSLRGGTLPYTAHPRDTLPPHEIWDTGEPLSPTVGCRVEKGPAFTEHLRCAWVPGLWTHVTSVPTPCEVCIILPTLQIKELKFKRRSV